MAERNDEAAREVIASGAVTWVAHGPPDPAEVERMTALDPGFCGYYDALGLLASGDATLRALHGLLGDYFAGAAEGKNYRSRPQLCLRLWLPGDPPAHLAVTPHWDRRACRLDVRSLSLEVVEDKVVGPYLVGRRIIQGLLLTPAGVQYRHDPPRPEPLARLLDITRQFLADPLATMARECESCCICQRRLTDPTSRARGIGPNCLGHAERLGCLLEDWRRRGGEEVTA
jgi:hypothetical protein